MGHFIEFRALAALPAGAILFVEVQFFKLFTVSIHKKILKFCSDVSGGSGTPRRSANISLVDLNHYTVNANLMETYLNPMDVYMEIYGILQTKYVVGALVVKNFNIILNVTTTWTEHYNSRPFDSKLERFVSG